MGSMYPDQPYPAVVDDKGNLGRIVSVYHDSVVVEFVYETFTHRYGVSLDKWQEMVERANDLQKSD